MSPSHHFFAYLARMKLIDRWSLMRCTQRENVQEHSLQVAIIAHALCLIKNKHFGGMVSPDHVALRAIFHDVTEVLTGDLPTPVKYFNSEIRSAYLAIEDHAVEQLNHVIIGDGAWLGENTCIIGASVGKNSVIGVNSVVTKNIPDYCGAIGSPAFIIKRFNFEANEWCKTDKDGNFI